MRETVYFTSSRGETVYLSQDPMMWIGVSGKGLPEADLYTRSGPGQRGSNFAGGVHRERHLMAHVGLDCRTYQDLYWWEQRLASALDPTLGSGVLTFVKVDGTVRCLRGAFIGGLGLEENELGIYSREMMLHFQTDGPPYWYDPDLEIHQFTGIGGGLEFPLFLPLEFTAPTLSFGVPSALTYRGNAPAQPVVEIDGPVLNPVLRSNTQDRTLHVRQYVPEGATLRVNMQTGQKGITMDAYNSTFTAIPFYGLFWELEEGRNVIYLSAESPRTGRDARISYNARYKSL